MLTVNVSVPHVAGYQRGAANGRYIRTDIAAQRDAAAPGGARIGGRTKKAATVGGQG